MKHTPNTAKNSGTLKTNKRMLRYRLKQIEAEIYALASALLKLEEGMVYNKLEDKLNKKIKQRLHYLDALKN